MPRDRVGVPAFAEVVCFSLIAAVAHLATAGVSYVLVLWIVERLW